MHVPMEMFAASADVKLLHVPYTGGGPAVVALLGGNVDALSTGPSTVIQHVKAGKVRVLATWGDKRLVALPDVPDADRSGAQHDVLPMGCAVRARGDARTVLTKLREAARAAAADPRFVSAMATVETPIPIPRCAGARPLLGRGRAKARRGGAAHRQG
jgi:tripartite-type tricarboxylate transporter receptor subunit TctC